ncbi:MAG: sigma-54-dependent Fis family transcriptional regulator, partial [Bdellovibrionales bacterium]|nr:sigma-54-dependent Fis family transcriptional regulator [Bdellovibrionales bacterium]
MNGCQIKYKILVVDDESVVIDSIKLLFDNDPEIEIIEAFSAKMALEIFEKQKFLFALVLMDYKLPEQSGADVTKAILKMNPHQIVAMYSGDEFQLAAIESWRSGAVDFIEKRSPSEITKNKILLCLNKYSESEEIFHETTPSENRKLIESVGLSGASIEMAKIASLIIKAASIDSPVLITGESGVGKEEVAKAIHRLSKRKNRNIVTENMPAIPHELFESTMFG